MTKIWILGLEPIEQRYSKQWDKQFEEVFYGNGLSYEFIQGDMVESNLQSKFFLDPVQTNIWKSTQLNNILRRVDEIKDGDVIFVFDFWFPGIEALKYTFTFLDMKVKIIGYAHAGSYDKWDLVSQYKMGKWAKHIENGWFEVYDKILVATEFHKKLILSKRKINKDKIKVVGFPLDIEKLHKKYMLAKDNTIVFTGRKSKEKGYFDILKLKDKGYNVKISLDKTKTKDEYYELLASSQFVISTSKQETFGIGIVEGMALGCIPIVPNRLSYPETVGDLCRDDDIVKNIDKILEELKTVDSYTLYKKAMKYNYTEVINNIQKELLEGD